MIAHPNVTDSNPTFGYQIKITKRLSKVDPEEWRSYWLAAESWDWEICQEATNNTKSLQITALHSVFLASRCLIILVRNCKFEIQFKYTFGRHSWTTQPGIKTIYVNALAILNGFLKHYSFMMSIQSKIVIATHFIFLRSLFSSKHVFQNLKLENV